MTRCSKRLSLPLAAALAALAAIPINSAAAEEFALPRPSPLASVSAMVGVTEIRVDYSSPAVKGRALVPDVVPLGRVWRAGANEATRI